MMTEVIKQQGDTFTSFINCLPSITNCKLFRVLKCLNEHIKININENGVQTRPSSSNGLWCCILLPTIIVLYSVQCPGSELYSLVACISVGFFIYCILFIIYMSVSCLVLRENIYGGCVASSILSALLMYVILDQGLIFSIIYSTLSIYTFSVLLRLSLTMFPKTFTIGEAMIVVQGATLLLVAMFSKFIFNNGDKGDSEMEFVNSINFTFVLSSGLAVAALNMLDDRPKSIQTLFNILSMVGVAALVMLHFFVGFDCIIQIIYYIFLNPKRIELFLLWLGISFGAGFVLTIRTKMTVKANTVTRKVFHVLASSVFMSGIIFDVHLMTLAAGFGLAVIIFAEALRKSNIDDVSEHLQSAFQVYSDEKDSGSFAVTPIYLYVGLACPLVLVPRHTENQLELLSGVLSIGIGDTAASWFGARYGFNKWSDTNKSMEGTVFNILTQILTVYLLELFGLVIETNSLIRTIVAATVSGLVEAKTDQIDNLILPLVTILAFQSTWFLAQ